MSYWKSRQTKRLWTSKPLMTVYSQKFLFDLSLCDISSCFKVQGGQKQVEVGTRIAFLADLDDDLNCLEFEDEAIPQRSNLQDQGAVPNRGNRQLPLMKPSQTPIAENTRDQGKSENLNGGEQQLKGEPGSHISPAVSWLMHRHNIRDVASISATGPKGRLTKGDVLAFLGQISEVSAANLQRTVSKREKLDLSDIRYAPQNVPLPSEIPHPHSKESAVELRLDRKVDLSRLLQIQEQGNLLGLFYIIHISADISARHSVDHLIQTAVNRALEDMPQMYFAKDYSFNELFDEVVGGSKKITSKLARLPKSTSRTLGSKPNSYAGGTFPLVAKIPSACFSLKAIPVGEVPSSEEKVGMQLLDYLIDDNMSSRRPLRSSAPAFLGDMLASLSIDHGHADANISTAYFDRVLEYIEAPENLV